MTEREQTQLNEREQIRLTLDGGIARVILNRPQVHNAISKTMWLALPAVLNNAQMNGAHAVVISGEGKSFASGADIGELKSLSNEAEARDYWLSIWKATNFLAEFALPTIAAIRGSCFGGGCLVAAACDLRYSTASATFGIPVAKFGIKLDDDNIGRIVRLVGPALSKEILFSAQPFSAARAKSIGFINDIVDDQHLEETVLATVKTFCDNSPAAIAQIKAAVARILSCPQKTGSQDQKEMIQSYLSVDCRERLARV